MNEGGWENYVASSSTFPVGAQRTTAGDVTSQQAAAAVLRRRARSRPSVVAWQHDARARRAYATWYIYRLQQNHVTSKT